MKILMVLTSHDVLGNTRHKTGFWLEEFAAPYFVFRDAGVQLTLASPKGGQPPLDPKSDLPENQTPAMTRFKQDQTAQKALSQTVKLADVKSEDYDTVFYVGGHGPMWDLAESQDSIALLESFYNSGKPIALVCHSPGVLRHVTYQGALLVKGKQVTGFTNGEEEEMHLTNVVPFLVEDELMRLGATFEKRADWQPLSVVDGRLITGQNPASSTVAAQNLMNSLAAEKSGLGYYFDRRPRRLVIGVRYAGQGDPGSSWPVESRVSLAQRKVIYVGQENSNHNRSVGGYWHGFSRTVSGRRL
jgi:putative intracellular protease/amidase